MKSATSVEEIQSNKFENW